MKTQRHIAVLIISFSSILTGYVLKDTTFPSILCILGLLGLRRKLTWDYKPERRVITLVLLLVLLLMFGIHYRYNLRPVYGYSAPTPTAESAWKMVTGYFLASMIMVLYLGSPRRLPMSLGLFHIVITISAGQLLLNEDQARLFRPMEVLAVVLVILYVATSLKTARQTPAPIRQQVSRWMVFAVILLVALNVGWISGSFLYRHQGLANHLASLLWGHEVQGGLSAGDVANIGFSSSGKLSSLAVIKSEFDDTPVLRIRSDRQPGYLRAKAFGSYLDSRSEWLERSSWEAVWPESSHLAIKMGGMAWTYSLSTTDPVDPAEMTIEHLINLEKAMFTPLSTTQVEGPLQRLMLDNNNLMYPAEAKKTFSYRVDYDRLPYRKAPSRIQQQTLLRIPRSMLNNTRIQQLQRSIFAGCETTQQKIDAVSKDFRDRYTYSLQPNIPNYVEDKLTHFLLEQKTGYCEYFASGAAMLLRFAEVPTRYVTGFFVAEREGLTDIWVARNMNAHAWVEAWDQQSRQWITVEATVEAELDTLSANDTGDDTKDRGVYLYEQLIESFYTYGLAGVIVWMYEYSGLYVTLAVFGPIALALAVLIVRLGKKRRLAHTKRIQSSTPEQRMLARLLRTMDKRVRRRGVHRDSGETVALFVKRLHLLQYLELANWYTHYNALRFCPHITQDKIHSLRQAMQRSK